MGLSSVRRCALPLFLLLLLLAVEAWSGEVRNARPSVERSAVLESQAGESFLRAPLALARDPKNGDLLVTSFEAGEVVILDRRGSLLRRLGREVGLASPHGVAIDRAGRIYVSEAGAGTVKVLSPSGTIVDELDLARIAERPVSPGRITFGPSGRLYVVDLRSDAVLVVSEDEKLLATLGKFESLQKAAEGPGGQIVVLSGRGKAVTVFRPDGELIRSFGGHGEPGERNVSFPTGFAVDAKGRVWIADAFQHRLKVFSLDGEFLFNHGGLEGQVEKDALYFPVDLAFGEKTELFVLEKGANRIQVLRIGDLE
ncbi:MAG: NHL repeat-containing protein [Deltaproteobacteria bacterium]|nr:NHL repeat-containing protein [Deltaproteobacteria bacterium]